MKAHFDKNDMQILPGDVICNEDSGESIIVIDDEDGNLYMGDYTKPIEDYKVGEYWEYVRHF